MVAGRVEAWLARTLVEEAALARVEAAQVRVESLALQWQMGWLHLAEQGKGAKRQGAAQVPRARLQCSPSGPARQVPRVERRP